MAHPDPQLPPSHRCGSTSAPSSNRWARDLPPSRRRPRTPTPLHTRLLLRGQHPPPRRLRGGSRHSHHPRNLLPHTHRCPDPYLSHDEQPRPRPLPHTRARRTHGHIRLHTVRAGTPAPLTTAGGHVNRTITRSRSPHPPHQDHEFRPGLPPPTPPAPRHRRGRMAWIRHTTVEAALPSDRQRAHLPAPHRSLLEDTAGISEGRAPIQTRGPVPPSGARSGAGMEPHPARLL